MTYDQTIGYMTVFSSSNNYVQMNKSHCMAAYMSGKLLETFARHDGTFGVVGELTLLRLLDSFWHPSAEKTGG